MSQPQKILSMDRGGDGSSPALRRLVDAGTSLPRPYSWSQCASGFCLSVLLLLVGEISGIAQFQSARQADRNGAPNWQISPAFKKDVFTFVRIKYRASEHYNYWGHRRWAIDFPDSDLNFSF